MKTIRQISRKNSDSSEEGVDNGAGVQYSNLSKNKTIDSNTVEDYTNPLFKSSSPEDSSELSDIGSTKGATYDELQFKSSNSIPKRPDQNTTLPPRNSPLPPRHSPQPPRTDTTKPPEEFEMGVSNHGYDNEKARPASWDKSLSAFNPYAVDTPIRRPVNATDARMNSLSTPDKRLSTVSKFSDYSAIDENPYASPSEKSPEYEDLAAMQAKHQRGNLPPRNTNSQKKVNMIYEPAVITKRKQISKTTSLNNDPKQGYEEEGSSYCHVIFTILVGLLALIALVVVFLVIFGVISAKKCKECDVTQVSGSPSTGQQTGTGDNADFKLELQYLRNNISALKKALDAVSKPDNKSRIIFLENEVQSQKLMVQSLTNELSLQRNITTKLNATTRELKFNISKTRLYMRISHMETKKNIAFVSQQLHVVNTTLTRDVINTKVVLERDLGDKITKANFTKLIYDFQNNLDKLVFWINTTSNVTNQLNETLNTVADNLNKTLYDEISTLSDTSNLLKRNLTQYNTMLTNYTLLASNNGFKGCKYDKSVGNKNINTNHAIANNFIYKIPPPNTVVVGATCDSSAITVVMKKSKNGAYGCECTGITTDKNEIICTIHMWFCPV